MNQVYCESFLVKFFFLILNQPQGIISFKEMAQEINVLAAKFEDLSSIPTTHNVEVENSFLPLSL